MHRRLGAALVAAVLVFAPGSPTTTPAGAIAMPGVAVVLDVRLFKTGSGSGRITSDPPYMNCGESCETSLEYGEQLVLIADPDPGSRFSKWTGFCAGQDSRCEFTLTVDVETTAVFTKVIPATPEPTEEPTPTPLPTIAPTATAAPTPTVVPAATAAPTSEPTTEPAPTSTEGGSGPIVILLAVLLVGLLGALSFVMIRGRRNEVI